MNLKKIYPSPYLLLGLTILFWSGNFVLGRGLYKEVPPVALSFWRWFTALLIILPFTFKSMLDQRWVILRFWKALVLFSFLGVAGFSTLVYIGLTTTTANNGVLLNTTSPVFIVLISRFILKKHLSWRQGLGVAVAFLGVMIIISRGDMAILMGLRLHPGDLFVLAGVLCWAVYTACLHMRPSEVAPLSFVGATVGIGTMMILPFYLWEMNRGAAMHITPPVMAGIFYLALFPSILAYVFWNHAVGKVGANTAGFFIYLMPVCGAFLSFIFLGESLLMYHLVGIVMIFSGVYLTTTMMTKN